MEPKNDIITISGIISVVKCLTYDVKKVVLVCPDINTRQNVRHLLGSYTLGVGYFDGIHVLFPNGSVIIVVCADDDPKSISKSDETYFIGWDIKHNKDKKKKWIRK